MTKRFLSGDIVAIQAGTHKGKAGQVRGTIADKRGGLPVMIDGKVRRIRPDNMARKWGAN